MKHIAPADFIIAIDIGTTKICVLVCQPAADGSLSVIGIGQAPSEGLARGVIVAMAPAVHAIRSAVREAELMSGFTINRAVIGISGSHIRAYSSHGMTTIKHGEIKEEDVRQVIQSAQAITLPDGQQLLHAVPHYFCINGHEIVHNPRGMHGVRLEAQVHIVTGAVSSVQNLVRCCELAGVRVHDIVLEPIASAAAVLSHDEKNLGVGILDIGGGTSDFAVYQRGAICHTHIIPIAGNVFTNDIAVCLRTSLQDAERVKREYGSVSFLGLEAENHIEVSQIDGHAQALISQAELQAILSARSEELLTLVGMQIEQYQLRPFMHAGIVITGGGSLLRGLAEQASQVLRMPARIGKPNIGHGMPSLLESPTYATGYGLIRHCQEKIMEKRFDVESGTLLHRVTQKMRSWIFDMF